MHLVHRDTLLCRSPQERGSPRTAIQPETHRPPTGTLAAPGLPDSHSDERYQTALNHRHGHVVYGSSQFRAGIRAPAVGKLDDITRLRMHRADDQDTLDLIRAFMSIG
ncbi:hypothetical protein FCI23_54785 [Actinacidiphila oryziradicis]|uniref:Uncharacterized protein n=1 Tax=Actinacidiphila oryziradicis TaxID=2571141 RepID=A0A4U0RXR0_9ACTN|nr:hypothetical protein FCI23_54785 [Actinacidiphila oryziradicis]